MDYYEITKKLIGKVYPVGETNIDSERYNNLIQMCDLSESLLMDIKEVSRLKDAREHSVKSAGIYADKFIEILQTRLKY